MPGLLSDRLKAVALTGVDRWLLMRQGVIKYSNAKLVRLGERKIPKGKTAEQVRLEGVARMKALRDIRWAKGLTAKGTPRRRQA